MALKNFTQFTPYTVLSSTDNFVGYRVLDEFRTDFNSLTDAISGLLISKGFTPGSSVGIVRRVSFRYTIGSGNNLNAVSGADDFGFTLSYKPTQIEVYRNGAHLAENLDFIASNGTQVTNLSTFSLGDILEVVALSSTVLTNYVASSGSGSVISPSFRYSVSPSNTITPGAFVIAGADDFGSVLSFVVPNFEVYLNGSHLVKDMDYGTYASGSSITLGDSVADGDIVDIVSLSANNISEIASITTYIGIQKIQAGKDIIISNFTGTGNVTLSAKPGIRDIKVPDWTRGAHVTNSSTLLQYLSAVAQSNRFTQASASYVEEYGSFPGTTAYQGGVLAPNGKVYFTPNTAAVGRIVDPSNNTVTTYGSFPGSNAYAGGVLVPNGKIYFAPHNSTVGRFVDPSNNSVTTYGTFPGSAAYEGAVLASNGKIYFVPSYATQGAIVDPSSNGGTSVQFYGSFPGVDAYSTGVLAPNGKIYFVPDDATVGAIVDPTNNSVTTYGSFPGSNAYEGGVLAPNGKIYFVPQSAIVGAVVDPSSNGGTSVQFYGSFPGGVAYSGGVLAPNGKIYFAPVNATVGRIVDPSNNTVTTYGSFPGSGAYYGGVLAPNGKIYFAPGNATVGTALCLLLNNNWNLNVCTNPFFNKY